MNTRGRTFIVRIWFEPSATGALWRASLTDVKTGERRFFERAEAFTAVLRDPDGAMLVAREEGDLEG